MLYALPLPRRRRKKLRVYVTKFHHVHSGLRWHSRNKIAIITVIIIEVAEEADGATIRDLSMVQGSDQGINIRTQGGVIISLLEVATHTPPVPLARGVIAVIAGYNVINVTGLAMWL